MITSWCLSFDEAGYLDKDGKWHSRLKIHIQHNGNGKQPEDFTANDGEVLVISYKESQN